MPANLDSGASYVKGPLLLVSSQILEKQAEEIYRQVEGDPFFTGSTMLFRQFECACLSEDRFAPLLAGITNSESSNRQLPRFRLATLATSDKSIYC